MAPLVRLRRALLRSSSIPNCCSFSPIPSDSSHLINLSKTLFPAASRLENPSIRPTPSKHDRRPPYTCSNRFLSDSHYAQHETKIPKDEIDSPTSPKPSPEEMIETFFLNLAKVMGSVEDAQVIEEVSDKLKNSSKEMIGQLEGASRRQKWRVEAAKVIVEMFDNFEKEFGLRKTELLKGDKCWNEVITPRSPSPPPEYENHVSVKDLEMIDEMHEKLTKYVEVLKKLKGIHGSAWRSYVLDRDSFEAKPQPRTRPLELKCTGPLIGGLRQHGAEIAKLKKEINARMKVQVP